jgi:uncharacterized protein YqeY
MSNPSAADQMQDRVNDNTIQDDIDNDYKEAFRNKEEKKYKALRHVLAKLKQVTIDQRKELTNEEIIKILKSELKSRKDALEQFKEGGRDDLIEQTEYEISQIEQYLPAQMSDEDLEKVVKETLEKVGASSPQDMGKAMGAVMKEVGDQADGGRVKEMVMKLLKS